MLDQGLARMCTPRRSFAVTCRGKALLLGLGLGLACPAVRAADWPTDRHDNARSGITAEPARPPLSACWTFTARHAPQPAWGRPKPIPVETILELPRVHFDDAFHVSVAAGRVYFGSSADNHVYCLDAHTGQVRWTFVTGGPVRLAPAVWNDRVLFGSDDGFAYCLAANNGSLIWKRRGAPSDRRVLGHGKVISLWPVRTGVLIDRGIAYFAAGIFPAEGVYLYACRADDGTIVWQNDTLGEAPQARTSPQGYLLASANTLYAPMGRVSPAAFSRADGRLLSQPSFGKRVGGTFALLAGDAVFTGTEEMVGYRPKKSGRGLDKFAWFPGRQLVVSDDVSYMATDREMSALDRRAYPKVSARYQKSLGKMIALRSQRTTLRSTLRTQTRQVQRDRAALAALDQQLARAKDGGGPAGEQRAALQARRQTQVKVVKAATDKLAYLKRGLAGFEDKMKTIAQEAAATEKMVAATVKWRCPCACSDSLILAGDVLFAGGQDQVVAHDAATGSKLWVGWVDGKARALAVADGRLLVSTDKGSIHCFGPPGSAPHRRVTQPPNAVAYAPDKLTPVYEAAAAQIVRHTGITRGFALVLGGGTGRLALALAKRTQLMIYCIEPDARQVAAARRTLADTGVYGARVCVDQGDLSRLPYPDYFANLVVSEQILVDGLDARSGRPNASELFRVLKPIGGTAYIGRPAGAKGLVKPLRAPALQAWLTDAGVSGVRMTDGQGVWAQVVRGELAGAGSWTHQYADPGNTACGDDRRVTGSLGVLWFGRPGPGKMVNRHARAAAPLSVGGRMFIQGENVVMAYDAYNGLKLWEREILGAVRVSVSHESGNLAANGDSLFVAAGDACLRLDAATGRTVATYTVPRAKDGLPRRWGYVACVGKLLYGSRTRKGRFADCVFAVDIASGRRQWTYPVARVAQPSIAIGDGRVFFADAGLTEAQRREAMQERIAKTKGLEAHALVEARKALRKADVRLVVALDATSGTARWRKPVDLTDCGFGTLSAIYHNKVLVFFGVHVDGHFWRQFFSGEFKTRRVAALSGDDGRLLWTRQIGYRVRPLVIGDTLHAEPWAFDLHTGKQRMRTHPVTGERQPWQFARPGHHCGCPVGSPNALFFRSSTLGYYDLTSDSGTMHFGAQRPGCWVNFIPAAGLLLFPEASSGCMCPYPNMCTVVFKPTKRQEAWAMYSAPGPMTPVKHLAVNIGAPGDRRAPDGTLWLGYPRARGHLVMKLALGVQLLPSVARGYFRRRSRGFTVAGTDKPWVYASGCHGLARCVLPLIGRGQEPGIYTVRLHFAELDNARVGQRVFDVKLQDKLVLRGLDIVKAAGAPHKAAIREFGGVAVRRDLRVELVPRTKNPSPDQAPVISGIEVVRIDDPTAMPPVAVFREPFEAYNLGYWYAEFVRRQAEADVAIVPRSALSGQAELHEAGPLRLAQVLARLEERRVIKSTVKGQELIRYLTTPAHAQRFNPLFRGETSSDDTLFYAGLDLTYDVPRARPRFGLSEDKTYTLATVWPLDGRSPYARGKPPLAKARQAAPLPGLKVVAKSVLPETTWDMIRRDAKANRLAFRRRYAAPPAFWGQWKRGIEAAAAARRKAELAVYGKRFTQPVVSAGGITWRLVGFDDFERPDWRAQPTWQVLQGVCAARDGRLQTMGTTFVGLAKKVRVPVRIEMVARQKDPCDLSPFLGTARGTYQAGYFFGFGSNNNSRNKILKKGAEVVGSGREPMIVPNRWHHIAAQVLPDKAQLIVDGELVLEHIDPDPVTSADMAGFITWQDAEVEYVRIYTGTAGAK